MHLLKELKRYTTPGHFLHDCSFDELVDLAKSTYHAFGTTRSAHMALLKDEKCTMEFFSQFLDPDVDMSFHQSDLMQVGDNTPVAPELGDEQEGTNGVGGEEGNSGEEDDTMGIPHLAEIDIEFGEDCPKLASQEQTYGNALMHNNALLWRDLLHYWETKRSAKEGDVGRLFKMNKVRNQYFVIYYC